MHTWLWGALGLLAGGVPASHLYYSHPPVPEEVIVVPFAGDPELGMLLESAAGVAAIASLEGGPRIAIWEDLDNDGYQRWWDGYRSAHRFSVLEATLEDCVAELHARGIVRGYLLYRYDRSDRPLHDHGPADESVNVATSLAAQARAVLVSERLEGMARSLGLRRLGDCRGMTEEQCFREHGESFTDRAVGTSDPKARNARSLMIAMNCFVSSGTGPAYEASLARCRPDSPVIGWGMGGEDTQTMPSSRYGLFQTATNWCHNLPLLATEGAPESLPEALLHALPRELPGPAELDWGDGRHYCCLTLTDGDNIQWVMGNFVSGPEGPSYYASSLRGAVPFTWGLPVPGLLELSPRTLAEILGTATSNDDFVLYSGGGYYYPDLYGEARMEDCIRLHASRLRHAMERTGIRIVAYNFQDWDSEAALAACRSMAQELPGLLGILAFQYYPYSAGNGRVLWVEGADGDRVPVVSGRYTVWAQTGREHDTTPSRVAAMLADLPVLGATQSEEDCFSWVLVHAWSRFRNARAGEGPYAEEDVPQHAEAPGSARGYEPAVWLAQALPDHCVPVTASEFLLRLRLRCDPERTLSLWARDLRVSGGVSPGLLSRVRRLVRLGAYEDALSALRTGAP